MKKLYKSFIMALGMFTIIPTPYVEWDDEGAKNMMKFYPVVGLIVGCIWSLIYLMLTFIDASLILKSAVLMTIPFLITGMLHLDGYMDVCDAILSRRDKEEKLRILKDPTTGAFAVIALIMLFFVDFGAIHCFLEKSIKVDAEVFITHRNIVYGLILIPIISRSIAAYFLLTRSTIKESSLGSYFKKGTNKADVAVMIAAFLICSILCCVLIDFKYIAIPLFMAIGGKCSVEKCRKEFGGISGDVAGFTLVVSELIGVLVVSLI